VFIYMYSIKVNFLSFLSDITGKNNITLTVEEKSTIMDLLIKLTQLFGNEFKNVIFSDLNDLSKYIIISLNGEAINLRNKLNKNLLDGDEVFLLPAIAGG